MDHPRSPDRDDRAGSPLSPRECTIAELYVEHWLYTLYLLPSYGISEQEAEDVAQTAWLHVHRRRDSYNATTHKTRRAWITGFVKRCAANHRRAQRREPVALEEPGEQASTWLDPEQVAILRDLHRMIPNDEHREALLLQDRHGLTIAEIAAVQEVSESTVGWRLGMARKALMNEEEEKKSRAYLGFGSLEALAKALKPGPIPPEVGERLWQKIAESIRQEEGTTGEADPPSSQRPASSQPPAAALPAQAATTAPALANAKLGILLAFAFVVGPGVLAWRAAGATEHGRATPATEAATAPASSSTAPSTATSTASSSTAPSTTTSTASSSTAATSTAPRTAAPSTATSTASSSTAATSTASSSTPGVNESQRLLAQMRDAKRAGQFSTVLGLAAQHAQQFGATNAREREALRIEALRQTGRREDAAQHARYVLAAYPEHRRALERAAGQALP